MIMKDKKGQLDKIISFFPSFIIIVIIMGIFLLLSFGIRGFSKGEAGDEGVYGGDVLLEEVEIDGKTYLVFEGLFLSGNRLQQSEKEKQFYDKFVKELVSFTDKDECFYLESQRNYFFINRGIFDPDNKEQQRPIYLAKNALRELLIHYQGKKEHIYSYYGECLR